MSDMACRPEVPSTHDMDDELGDTSHFGSSLALPSSITHADDDD